MYYIIILVLATFFLFLWLRKKLSKSPIEAHMHKSLKNEYDNLSAENKMIKEANHRLQDKLDSTMALYDITKQISKTLDADKVFACFKEKVREYVTVNDCKFLKGNQDLSVYKDCLTFPLSISGELIGHLVVEGLKEEERDKFYILSQQFLLGIKRAILYQDVQELAIIDSLTKVFNRRYYLERFKEELERSQKFNYRFCCLMIDIDYFKEYNDRYGHIVGDTILRELSKIIQQNIRQIDLMGRYGGEEFSVILSQTDKEAAGFAAERIRQAIEEKRIKAYDEELKVTVSIGISVFPGDGKDMKTLIDKADTALYRAKEGGRNKVCLY
ncbi:MAG: GGDEF domain-containing protein [Candidatus Omnitrophica bacterium]|nr:GGDEF domain-containing protein [Candidatus Omnitrophota bacterium]MDD5592004.1 GGDEF domain-containing protein [Candidatus Omnitrophota bacterium]